MSNSVSGIGIIVLAAGYSKRFAGDKRQAPLSSGKTVLDTTLSQIPDSFTQRVLVLHPGDETLAERYTEQWTICFAQQAQQGMGHSLSAAMAQVDAWQAALIALGDMPFVQTSTYQEIQKALCSSALVRPYCQGRPGNPVGIGAEYFAELTRLEGDQGARSILQRNEGSLFRLECQDWGIITDIDTPSELI